MAKIDELKIEVGQNRLFLNPDIHVEDHPELVHERKEVNNITQRISNYFADKDRPAVLLINGCSGSGKTLTTLYSVYNFLNENPGHEGDIIYIDGGLWRSPKSMLSYLASSLGIKKVGSQIANMLDDITKEMNKQRTRKLIIIDEVDKIYKNSRESPKYFFLQSLNRLNITPKPTIILITNQINFLKYIGDELAASITELILEAYTAEDLIQILKKRADFCLPHSLFNIQDLAKIASEAYKNPIGGDRANARHTINILAESARLAEEKTTSISAVLDQAIDIVRINDYVKLLRRYNKHQLILCAALAELKKEHARGIYSVTNPDFKTEEICTRFFEMLDNEGINKISDRQVFNYLDQFSKENLVMRLSKGRISFLEEPENILEALQTINNIH